MLERTFVLLLFGFPEEQTEHSFFGILYSTITSASCQRATITELITIVGKTPQAAGTNPSGV